MLNKFFKTIHNKYSRLFKFIFFLRYLFATFFVSIFLFLIVPIFLNHEKKVELINNYLEEPRKIGLHLLVHPIWWMGLGNNPTKIINAWRNQNSNFVTSEIRNNCKVYEH